MANFIDESWINSFFSEQLFTNALNQKHFLSPQCHKAQLIQIVRETPEKKLEVIVSDSVHYVYSEIIKEACDEYKAVYAQSFSDIKGCFINLEEVSLNFCARKKYFYLKIYKFNYIGSESETIGDPSDINETPPFKEVRKSELTEPVRLGQYSIPLDTLTLFKDSCKKEEKEVIKNLFQEDFDAANAPASLPMNEDSFMSSDYTSYFLSSQNHQEPMQVDDDITYFFNDEKDKQEGESISLPKNDKIILKEDNKGEEAMSEINEKINFIVKLKKEKYSDTIKNVCRIKSVMDSPELIYEYNYEENSKPTVFLDPKIKDLLKIQSTEDRFDEFSELFNDEEEIVLNYPNDDVITGLNAKIGPVKDLYEIHEALCGENVLTNSILNVSDFKGFDDIPKPIDFSDITVSEDVQNTIVIQKKEIIHDINSIENINPSEDIQKTAVIPENEGFCDINTVENINPSEDVQNTAVIPEKERFCDINPVESITIILPKDTANTTSVSETENVIATNNIDDLNITIPRDTQKTLFVPETKIVCDIKPMESINITPNEDIINVVDASETKDFTETCKVVDGLSAHIPEDIHSTVIASETKNNESFVYDKLERDEIVSKTGCNVKRRKDLVEKPAIGEEFLFLFVCPKFDSKNLKTLHQKTVKFKIKPQNKISSLTNNNDGKNSIETNSIFKFEKLKDTRSDENYCSKKPKLFIKPLNDPIEFKQKVELENNSIKLNINEDNEYKKMHNAALNLDINRDEVVINNLKISNNENINLSEPEIKLENSNVTSLIGCNNIIEDKSKEKTELKNSIDNESEDKQYKETLGIIKSEEIKDTEVQGICKDEESKEQDNLAVIKEIDLKITLNEENNMGDKGMESCSTFKELENKGKTLNDPKNDEIQTKEEIKSFEASKDFSSNLYKINDGKDSGKNILSHQTTINENNVSLIKNPVNEPLKMKEELDNSNLKSEKELITPHHAVMYKNPENTKKSESEQKIDCNVNVKKKECITILSEEESFEDKW